MWIFWAVVAMFGSSLWYLAPKFFPSQNSFSPLVISGIAGIVIGLVGSKIFHKTWFDPSAIPLGILLALTWIATVGLLLSLNAGGKVGPIAVIIELSVILATLVALFFFKEHLHWLQIVGIVLAAIGIGLVLFFQK
jgi:drug/metabolite transporter (DMT)-like permease